jgi:hypothetical protein
VAPVGLVAIVGAVAVLLDFVMLLAAAELLSVVLPPAISLLHTGELLLTFATLLDAPCDTFQSPFVSPFAFKGPLYLPSPFKVPLYLH